MNNGRRRTAPPPIALYCYVNPDYLTTSLRVTTVPKVWMAAT